jgi:hypothetical protein
MGLQRSTLFSLNFCLDNGEYLTVLFRFYLAEDKKEQICADLGLSGLHFNRVLHRARERYLELYKRLSSDKLR